MRDKVEAIKERYLLILDKLSEKSDQATLLKLNKERSQLGPIVENYDRLLAKESELSGNLELLREGDEELKSLAKEEVQRLKGEIDQIENEIKVLLLPKDPLDE